MRKTRKLLRLATLCLGASLALTLCAFASRTGTTTGDALRLRASASTSAKIYSLLEKGTKLDILDEENGWYKVRCSDGTVGYVSASYITVSFTETKGTVTGGTINVRKGPGTNHSKVSTVYTGKSVNVTGEESGWYKVSFDGMSGYIRADFIELAAAESATEAPAEVALPETEETVVEETIPAEESAPAEDETVYGVVVGGTINVRKGPGTDYGKITSVRSGKSVVILGEENGWYKLSFDDVTGYIRSDFIQKVSNEVSAVGAAVAAASWNYLGVPYVYGGSSPNGFDCSGFTLYLYKQHGISLPHGATAQYNNCGEYVAKENLQPGDLVFFSDSSHAIGHCAVYVGDDTIIHARSSVKSVVTNKLSSSYYSSHYVGAKRIG